MIFNIIILGGGSVCALILIGRYVYRNILGHTPTNRPKTGKHAGMKSWPKSDCRWIPDPKRW